MFNGSEHLPCKNSASAAACSGRDLEQALKTAYGLGHNSTRVCEKHLTATFKALHIQQIMLP